MNIKVMIANNALSLSRGLSAFSSTATVEAEFGDDTVSGTILTLAHHGANKGRPCPCSIENIPDMGIEVIGISHLDLDTVGGIMAILGAKPSQVMRTILLTSRVTCAATLWKAAEFVDTNGVHKLETFWANLGSPWNAANVRDNVSDMLNAWWAWSDSHSIVPERDGSVTDVTDKVEEAIAALKAIFSGEKTLILEGQKWASEKEKLDSDSFVSEADGVILRKSESFTNHLYRSGRAVVALNTTFTSVTVSLADPIEGVNCREIVQGLWGPEAGGHDGIAGSPRGISMTMKDAEAAFEAVKAAIR